MSDPKLSESEAGEPTREEMLSALFAHMVIQQSNMAMLLMGKTPHPQTGQSMRDLEGARMFIDQLEMLQVKTKGNLSKEEEHLLKQSLLSLQMAFVETVETPAPPAPPAAPAKPAPPSPAPAPAAPSAESPAPSGEDPAAHKKFSKKY